ncbi:hypothetical protein D3C72_1904360 [compost metagenome]
MGKVELVVAYSRSGNDDVRGHHIVSAQRVSNNPVLRKFLQDRKMPVLGEVGNVGRSTRPERAGEPVGDLAETIV